MSHDEPSTFAHGVSTPLGSTAKQHSGRTFLVDERHLELGLGSGLERRAGSGTPASILSDLVTTPNGTTRHIDINTIDMYWFAGSRDPSWSGYMLTPTVDQIYDLSVA